MQEVFEKIIEKLEEKHEQYINQYGVVGGNPMAFAVKECKEIVKHESEKYKYSECGFVSKSDVLKVIEDIKCNDNTPKNYGTLLDIMRKIRILPTVRYIDWIPCSDRLPNQDGEFTDVLITCESIADGVFVQSAEFYVATDGSPVFDSLYHYERVLAWRPLPDPYQPKGE